MQMSTHSSSTQNVNSSYHPATNQNSSGKQRQSINSRAPENRGPSPYSVFPPTFPLPQAGYGPQHFEPYPLYSQSPVATSLPAVTFPVGVMNGGINQPYQTYIVTGTDLLFGLQPSGPRQLVYPYQGISNPSERDVFLRDPRLTSQQQVSAATPQLHPSRYAHPTHRPINPPIFYSPFGTQSIGVPPLNPTGQPSYRPRVFPAPNTPKGSSHNIDSGSLLSRGPPRKPRQSGFALWVGNLPGKVQIRELKDFFGMDELESILLIKKSNCAFVNYKTEESCEKAVSQFNNKMFKNVPIVCRRRRYSSHSSRSLLPSESVPNTEAAPQPTSALGNVPSCDVNRLSKSNPIHYFIMKSLTKNELAWSVANNVWTTQSHNERALNEAFTTSKTVFLIFSVNKSGEFFGYARMTSEIPIPLETGISDSISDRQQELVSPQIIGPNITVTPRTDTIPEGKIFEDAVRGTIFWEAVDVADDAGGSDRAETSWGNIFSVEWIKWQYPLPFHRTRNLLNPWNDNREIKISRDGTEVEPSVGALILDEFDLIAASQAPPTGFQGPAQPPIRQH